MDRAIYDRLISQDAEHWWFVARRAILHDQIGALALPERADILEIGCGAGGNLAMLSQFGTLHASETDPQARSAAAGRSGLGIAEGALPEAADLKDRDFDLVAAFDVLEHIDEDRRSVRRIAELVRPGGHFIMTVPAYRWMWSVHDDLHHHKRRYRAGEVRALAERVGMSPVKVTYFNTFLFPPIALVRIAKKALGLTESADDAMPGPAVNGALKTVFAAERPFLRRMNFPFGLSILMIARKD